MSKTGFWQAFVKNVKNTIFVKKYYKYTSHQIFVINTFWQKGVFDIFDIILSKICVIVKKIKAQYSIMYSIELSNVIFVEHGFASFYT